MAPENVEYLEKTTKFYEDDANKRAAEAEIKAIFEKKDADKDGLLNLQEFIEYTKSID